MFPVEPITPGEFVPYLQRHLPALGTPHLKFFIKQNQRGDRTYTYLSLMVRGMKPLRFETIVGGGSVTQDQLRGFWSVIALLRRYVENLMERQHAS